MIRFITHFLCLFLAASAGVWKWKQLNVFFKIITVQLIIAATNSIITEYVIRYLHWGTNYLFFNFYTVVETVLLLMCLKVYPLTQKAAIWLYASVAVFSVAWLCETIAGGNKHFSNYSLILEFLLVTGWYIYLLYKCVFDHGAHKRNAYLWLCLGIIIHCGCLIPYFSLFNYLQAHFPELNKRLYMITLFTGNLRYFFTTIALLVYKPTPLRNRYED